MQAQPSLKLCQMRRPSSQMSQDPSISDLWAAGHQPRGAWPCQALREEEEEGGGGASGRDSGAQKGRGDLHLPQHRLSTAVPLEARAGQGAAAGHREEGPRGRQQAQVSGHRTPGCPPGRGWGADGASPVPCNLSVQEGAGGGGESRPGHPLAARDALGCRSPRGTTAGSRRRVSQGSSWCSCPGTASPGQAGLRVSPGDQGRDRGGAQTP